MKRALIFVIAALVTKPVLAQEPLNPDEVQKGRQFVALVCSYCHVATPEQKVLPVRQPPAKSFETIANQRNFSAEWLRNFLSTTHRDIDNPSGMPNPRLMDFEIKELTAYFMSLRKQKP